MLAKPGYCYFAAPFPLKVSNLNLGRRDVVVMLGQNVGAGWWTELEPPVQILMPRPDAEVLKVFYGAGSIADREWPDLPLAETHCRYWSKFWPNLVTVQS